jgi:hypothetical protein
LNMDLGQRASESREKINSILSKVDRKLPENWRYYSQTAVGLLLTVSAVGNFLAPYISVVTSLSFLVAGLYTIPDIRFRVLYRLDIRPPKHSVSIVLVLGLLIGSMATSQSAIPGPENRADLQVESRDLTVIEEKPVKHVIGTAEVRNRGLVSQNFTAGIFVNDNLRNRTTFLLNPGDSETLNLSTEVQREGDQTVVFFTTRGERVVEDNFTGFDIQRSITLPHYLNEENIRTAITGYSRIPQKKFNNITELEVSSTGEGNRVRLVNRLGNVFDTYNLIKTASVNSFHASKKIYQRFEDVEYVTVVMESDYTYPNGTVEIRDGLVTGLSREDAEEIDWDNSTGETRFGYSHWLKLTSTYKIEEELCKTLSSDVECSK